MAKINANCWDKIRVFSKQNIPPKVATSPGRKGQLVSSNNYVIVWLSSKFHVSESIIDDLLEFTWRSQIIRFMVQCMGHKQIIDLTKKKSMNYLN